MTNKKIIITEAQFKEMLKETMGISQIIQNAATDLFHFLSDKLKTKEGFQEIEDIAFTQNDYTKQYTFNFPKLELLNLQISVRGIYRNFLLKDMYDNILTTGANLFEGYSRYYGRGRGEIYLNFCAVCGRIKQENTIDSIAHELTHLYQDYLCEQTYKLSSKDQQRSRTRIFNSSSLNARCLNDMQSIDENETKVGRLMYICISTEVNANINGLFAYGVISTSPYSFNLIKESPAWQFYSEGINLLEDLKTSKEMQAVLGEKYKSFSINRIEHILNDYKNRICKAAIMIRDNKPKQGLKS